MGISRIFFWEEEELSILLSHEQQLFALMTYLYGYILVLRMDIF